MFLNEDFLKLWEELSELNEAKADTQRLIDFAGEDLTNRFLAIKSRLKSPENDLYYWIKNKTPEEFEQRVVEVENTKSTTSMRKDAIAGADLVQETPHWKIYHITTFEASQYYGRDTKWCITGVNNYGDKYWRQYTNKGIAFYFLIAKDNYDPRGNDSKIALAIYPNKKHVEVYNQQDYPIFFSAIPYCKEINIPGIDFQAFTDILHCRDCGEPLDTENAWIGLSGEPYCEDCFKEYYFKCAKCDGTFRKLDIVEDSKDNCYCPTCGRNVTANSGYKFILNIPGQTIKSFADTPFQVVQRLANYLDTVTTADRECSTLDIMSMWTGEIIYPVGYDTSNELKGTEREILTDVEKVLKEYHDDIKSDWDEWLASGKE
jgi:hypothetical protein